MDAWTVLLVIAAMTALLVVLPVGAATSAHYRRARSLRCPLAGIDASVTVDAARAARAEVLGGRALTATACSRWPVARGCRQQCLQEEMVARSAAPRAPWVEGRTILVPLDGTPESESVLATIADLAWGEGAHVRLLRVAPPAMPVEADGRIVAYVDQETSRLELEGLAYLRAVASRAPEVTMEPVVRFGEPAEEIVREAEASGADLIAMATRDRAGIAELVRASVADEVARATRVPVLRVPCAPAAH